MALNPAANLFKVGHRMAFKISSGDDNPEDLYQVGHEHLCSQTPNTVTIFDYGRTPDGLFYYAMELLDGASLAEMVDLDRLPGLAVAGGPDL